MKNIIKLLGLAVCTLLLSCNDDPDYNNNFVAIPKTEVGAKLVNNTELVALVKSDSTYKVTDGVNATEFAYVSMKGSAMKIFIFEVDLTNPAVDMKVSMPYGKNTYAMQPMTEQATYMDKEGHKVWGGFNADFYNMTTGVPRGVLHREGVVLKTNFDSGERGVFAITDRKKALAIPSGEYKALTDTVKLQEAVGGGVMLVREGNVLAQSDVTVEPRTAVGYSADSTTVYVLAVDGRSFSYSNGMTYLELGETLKALGAHTAINLDGGGSTTFFIRNTPEFTDDRFEVRNWPTDKGGQERSVADGFVIISKN